MKNEDIQHLAKLARISISPEDGERMATDIETVLAYVNEIQEIVGDETIEKETGPHFNQVREDGEPHESGLYTEDLLNASATRNGKYIQVQKVLSHKK